MADERRRRRSGSQAAARSDAGPRGVTALRCPFCHDEVPQDALAARCAACQTVHHATCFDERRGCSVDGCSGRAAHVVKGWRAALGPCKACSAKVYLDENVALCKACEARHHPACLEAHGGCVECGSGEGTIVSAGTYKKVRDRARRLASVASGFAFALVLVAVALYLAFPRVTAPFAVGTGASLLGALLFVALAAKIQGGSHSRAAAQAQPAPIAPRPGPDPPKDAGGTTA